VASAAAGASSWLTLTSARYIIIDRLAADAVVITRRVCIVVILCIPTTCITCIINVYGIQQSEVRLCTHARTHARTNVGLTRRLPLLAAAAAAVPRAYRGSRRTIISLYWRIFHDTDMTGRMARKKKQISTGNTTPRFVRLLQYLDEMTYRCRNLDDGFNDGDGRARVLYNDI